MNAALLQNFYTGLETLMRERRQLLARRMLAVEPSPSVASFPLTPALSLGERENHLPVHVLAGAFMQSPTIPSKLPGTGDQTSDSQNVRTRDLLSPLPGGEGQGEGKATLPQFKPAQKPESLPS